MNSILEKIWTCVKNRRQAPQKPAIFPIVSLADMDIFEKFEEDEYLNAVSKREIVLFRIYNSAYYNIQH